MRLARLLGDLLPEDGEVVGLLALMLLIEARRAARVSSTGELVPLADQDRRLWDGELIAEGHTLVRGRIDSGVAPGRYELLAAINAVHTDGDTPDWAQIVALYDHLMTLDDSPIVRLNRAVAVGESEGREVALPLVEALAPELSGYHAFHAARADLLRRMGSRTAAHAAYESAVGLTANAAEVAYLTRRVTEMAE